MTGCCGHSIGPQLSRPRRDRRSSEEDAGSTDRGDLRASAETPRVHGPPASTGNPAPRRRCVEQSAGAHCGPSGRDNPHRGVGPVRTSARSIAGRVAGPGDWRILALLGGTSLIGADPRRHPAAREVGLAWGDPRWPVRGVSAVRLAGIPDAAASRTPGYHSPRRRSEGGGPAPARSSEHGGCGRGCVSRSKDGHEAAPAPRHEPGRPRDPRASDGRHRRPDLASRHR